MDHFQTFVNNAFWTLLVGGVGLLVWQLKSLNTKLAEIISKIAMHEVHLVEHSRRLEKLEEPSYVNRN